MSSTQHPDRIDYSEGGFAVSVSRDGSIRVKPGDSLSKYSMAIYGDFKHMDRFVRPNGMGYKAIENINLIQSGETLYHQDVLDVGQSLPLDPTEPPKALLFTEQEIDAFLQSHSIQSRKSWHAMNPKNPLDPACSYDTIVIHHAGTMAYRHPMAVQIRHRYRGFDDMGYHFMITDSGTIYEGRRVNYKGAHVKVANTGKLGILIDGCFEPGANWIGTVVAPSQAQFSSLDKLLRALQGFLKTSSILGGHLDYMQTDCPGQLLYKELPNIRVKHGFQKPACSAHPY